MKIDVLSTRQVAQLLCFPVEPVTHVERIHGGMLVQGLAEQDGTVKTAADQNGELGVCHGQLL